MRQLVSGFSKVRIEIKIRGFIKWNVLTILLRSVYFLGLMLDRTEIRFCRANHCTNKSYDTHTIRAIGAMEFGYPIQILQFLAVKDDEVFAREFRNAVNRKARPLVKRNKGIQYHQRKNHAVDDGAGNQIDWP